MANTKEQWVELINLKLNGGDAPAQIEGRYSYQEIEIYLNLAFADVLTQAWAKSPDMISDYIRTKKCPISFDAMRDERYVQLNEEVLPLPENRGIVQIRQPKNPYMEFAINDVSSNSVFSQLEVGTIGERVGCYVEGKNIYFDYKLPKTVDEVMVKYITTFEGLGDDDAVIVPGGNNQAVVDAVYRLMLKDQQAVNQDNMVRKQV